MSSLYSSKIYSLQNHHNLLPNNLLNPNSSNSLRIEKTNSASKLNNLNSRWSLITVNLSCSSRGRDLGLALKFNLKDPSCLKFTHKHSLINLATHRLENIPNKPRFYSKQEHHKISKSDPNATRNYLNHSQWDKKMIYNKNWQNSINFTKFKITSNSWVSA